MNSKIESKSYKQKEIGVNNIYLVMKKINETVTIDEKLKRRTRNGGFIAWPEDLYRQRFQETTNA